MEITILQSIYELVDVDRSLISKKILYTGIWLIKPAQFLQIQHGVSA